MNTHNNHTLAFDQQLDLAVESKKTERAALELSAVSVAQMEMSLRHLDGPRLMGQPSIMEAKITRMYTLMDQ